MGIPGYSASWIARTHNQVVSLCCVDVYLAGEMVDTISSLRSQVSESERRRAKDVDCKIVDG